MVSITDMQMKLIEQLPKSDTLWKVFVSRERVYACNPEHPPQILWRDESGEITWKEIVMTEKDFETEAGKEFQAHIRRESAKTTCQVNAGQKGFRTPRKKR